MSIALHTDFPFALHCGFEPSRFAPDVDRAEATVAVDESHQGLPGIVHGGLTAALCDGLAWQSATAALSPDTSAYVADLHVRFLRTIPADVGVIHGRFHKTHTCGRTVTTSGLVFGPDEKVFAQAHAAIRVPGGAT